jgi:hypothetical protein
MSEMAASSALEELLDSLPPSVVAVAELVSFPQWIDNPTAEDVVGEFSALNGATVGAIADLKRLPLVSSIGERKWKIASPAREGLMSRVEEQRPELAWRLNSYLAERFAAEAKRFEHRNRAARELRWRSIYHLMPVATSEALSELDGFIEQAGSARHSDISAAIELTKIRGRWLVGHQIETAFVLGRGAYALKDFATAEARFLEVWESQADAHRRSISGNLLGVIWIKRNEQAWWSKAEEVLREAAALEQGEGNRYSEAMILTTLGALQAKSGDDAQLKAAERTLRRSIELSEATGGNDGRALSALGAVLMTKGTDGSLHEAEQLLRRSLTLLPADARDTAKGRLARVLGRLGGPTRLREAEELLRDMKGDRGLDRAMTLNTTAATLMKHGDPENLERAEAAILESIELTERLNEGRHTAMALLTGSFIAERQAKLELAIERMERLIELNRALGLAERVEESAKRLKRLRRKLRQGTRSKP